MTCGMCGTSQFYPAFHTPDVENYVERETSAKAVIGVNGQPYPLDQALVPVLDFPRGEWAAVIVVRGVPTVVHRNTAIETFNEALRIYQINEEPFWFMNIWLNLNRQWIPRVPIDKQIVTVEQLEAISNPVSP